MSKKHVDEYYAKVCSQYMEMKDTLTEFEKDLEEGLGSPQALENIKTVIAPLKENYLRWSYMMYLLNMPNRKEKIPAYKRRLQNSKLEDGTTFPQTGDIEDNEKVIDTVKELKVTDI